MNKDAKIHLSPAEMELVQNADWLLTKNTIIEKVYFLLGEVSEEVRMDLASSPKISRGENYLGLPWVMLDYPRLFGKSDTLAVRVFFWWGNYFSITLHLKGNYLDQYRQNILDRFSTLEKHDFHMCIGDDEWRHEFTVDNYVPMREIGYTTFKEMVQKVSFCKLSVKISFEQWSRVKTVLYELYEVIFEITGHQLPKR